MSLRLLTALFMVFSISVFAEDYKSVCQGPTSSDEDLSVFNCSKKEDGNSLKMIQRLSGAIGKSQCKFLNMYLKKDKIQLNDFMIYDKKRGKSRPLNCYCKEQIGEGICEDESLFVKKQETLKSAFEIKAWGNFVKDLFEVSIRGGESCIGEVRNEIGKENCFARLDELHKKAIERAASLEYAKDDFEMMKKSPDVDQLLLNLKDFSDPKGEDLVFEPKSGYPNGDKSIHVGRFKDILKLESVKELFDLNSSQYEQKMEKLGQKHHLATFLEVLRSDNPEKGLRANFPGGIDFFSRSVKNDKSDLVKRMTLAMHPDLKWLFPGISVFTNADRERQKEKFLKFANLAKENPFVPLKELRLLYEEKEGSNCEEMRRKVNEICKMDSSQVLAMGKELLESGEIDRAKSIVEDDASYNELNKVTEELSCFEFPIGYQVKDSEISKLVARSNDPKVMLDWSAEPISITEAKVDLAVAKVEGMEDVAKEIERIKTEGKNPAKGIAMELKFRDYLTKLELPDGNLFSYSGDDVYQGVAEYKKRVYEWADSAVERRLNQIQGETEAIVKGNDRPAIKKAKLERLMNEVQRLNNGEFLEEIFQQKQAIADQIARYEDEKRNWESQYGEEAKANPKAVQPVAPKRSQTRVPVNGGGGTKSYSGVTPIGGSLEASAPGTASSTDEAVAYIPPRPSLPYAQGSLLTRIVPKDEFQDNTVKASLLAKHKGYPIAVLDEKKLQVELYTPVEGTNYKLQETLSIDEAEARGYVFPEDVKALVDSYKTEKGKGRAPASFVEYEPTEEELAAKQKRLSQLASLADTMERQGVPRRARVVRLNNLLDSL